MRLFRRRKSEPAPPPQSARPEPADRFPGMGLGAGSFIDPTAQILGWSDVDIGENCVVSEGCWLNTNDRSRRATQISIGHGSLLGRRGFIGSGRSVEIGPYFLSGPDCKIVCSDHVIDDPFVPYCASGNEVGASIRIGCNVWLGAGVYVLGNVAIGCGSVIGAGSVVLTEIPAFAIAVGTPARVIKRYDVAARRWIPVQDWTDEMEARLPREEDYLAGLREKWGTFAPPVQAAGHNAGNLP